MASSWSPELLHLRDILADPYWREEDARRIVVEAGMDPILVEFSPRPINTWQSILEQAHIHRQIDALLTRAVAEHPHIQAAYQAWIAAGRPGIGAIPPRPVPQRALLQELQRNFVGRLDELTWIEERLADRQDGLHLVIDAPAGFGKSALMSRLIALHPDYLYHFTRAEDQNHTATALLTNLCGQLSARLGAPRVYTGVALADLEEEFERLKADAVAALPTNGRLVIVIDGLDEAERRGADSVFKPKYFRTDLPQLRFVLTYRSGFLDPGVDLDVTRFHSRTLKGLEQRHVGDLFRQLGRADLADDPQLAAQIIATTRGEPFYLRFLVQDLAEQPAPVTVTADLPHDAKVYIARQVKNLSGTRLLAMIPEEVRREPFRTRPVDAVALILQVLSVAQDWITRHQLFRILADIERDLIEVLIDALRRYLVIDRPDDLTRVLDERYLVTPLKLKEAIRDAYTTADLQAAEQRLVAFCRTWAQAEHNPYAFNYLTRHLAALGLYEELVQTLDRPFLRAKAHALAGMETTLVDLERGLRASLERSDYPKIIRLLVLMARTKRAIEQRAFSGGVVISARKRLYEIALTSARAVDDIEMRFRQLLLIAEIAAAYHDHAPLLKTVDEALNLTIDRRGFHAEDAADLLTALVVEYHDLDRALALARLIDDHPNEVATAQLLETALPMLIRREPAYALELLDRPDVPDNCYRYLQLAEALGDHQPDLTRALLERAERRARDSADGQGLLLVAAALRAGDPPAAERIVRVILADLTGADLAGDRNRQLLMNHATMELAHINLDEAVDLALTACPDVVDSFQSSTRRYHTRYGTIAYCLERANKAAIPLDVPLLQAIFTAVQPANRPAHPEMHDEVLHQLVQQWVRRADHDQAQAAFQLIENPNVRARAALFFARSRLMSDSTEVGRLVAAMKDASDPGVLSEFKRLSIEQGPFALRVLGVLALLSRAEAGFHLAHAALEAPITDQRLLVESALRAIAAMQPDDQVRSLCELAPTVARLDRTAAGAILDRSVVVAADVVQGRARRFAWRAIAEAASGLGLKEIAAQAVQLEMEALQHDPEADAQDFAYLGRFVLKHRVILADNLLKRLLQHIADAYIIGKLVATLSDGEAYVEAQVATVPLPLQKHIYSALLVRARAVAATASLHRMKALFPATSDQTAILTLIGTIAAKEGDTATAEAIFQQAWDQLDREPIPDHLSVRELREYQQALHDQQLFVIEAWSAVNPQTAALLSERLPPWDRHLALVSIAAQMRDDPGTAQHFFEQAAAVVASDDTPINQCHALWNVFIYAYKAFPTFAEHLLARAIALVQTLKEERDPIITYLGLIAKAGRLPDRYQKQLWEGLYTSLGQVKWGTLADRQLFHVLEDMTNREHRHAACLAIANALQQQSGSALLRDSDGLAHLALLLADGGASSDALRLLSHCERLWHSGRTYDRHLYGKAYSACAKRRLKLPEAADDLQSLLSEIADDLRESPKWAYSEGDALVIVGQGYDGITDDEPLWNRLIDLATRIVRLDQRGEALLGLVQGALNHNAFDKAIMLATHIPTGADQAEAVGLISDGLKSTIAATLTDDQQATWQKLHDVAGYTIAGLLICAGAWCDALLQLQPSKDTVEAAVETILHECAFAEQV